MSAAISFESVSKHYRGAQAYQSLREDLAGLLRLRRAPRSTSRRCPM